MVSTLIKAFKPLLQCGNKAPKYQDLNCDTGYKVSVGKRKRREDSEGEIRYLTAGFWSFCSHIGD